MLVLLIIMMLIAPMLQQGVPAAARGRELGDKPDASIVTVVAIDARGKIMSTDRRGVEDLVPRVQCALEDKKEKISGPRVTRTRSMQRSWTPWTRSARQIENIALITERKNLRRRAAPEEAADASRPQAPRRRTGRHG